VKPLLLAVCAAATLSLQTSPHAIRGLGHAAALAAAYDAILDADFVSVQPRLGEACLSVPVMCEVMDAVSISWQIALDPDNHSRDAAFAESVERAIVNAETWTKDEPQRAEAWFARGAAYGARAQWRVLRKERLAAARDGKRIKEALERALEIDPDMHDAQFGIGMYRYYAAVAPSAFRFLRWLLLLPGGDRSGGLQQMLAARDRGRVVRGEAEYQLHLIYLWYEHRPADALLLIRDLETRYPRNPLFALIEADIQDKYFHDAAASERTLRSLIARAETKRINQSTLAVHRASQAIASLHARTKR
jgi:hypothetical protein